MRARWGMQSTALLLLICAWAGPVESRKRLRKEDTNGEDEAFIGWNGETYRPKDAVVPPLPEARGSGQNISKPWIETISWNPRAFVYHNFLSVEEADHLVHLVEHSMFRSSVIDTKTGRAANDPIRTSYGGAIGMGQTHMVAAVEQRIADWTQLPPSHQEPLQVLRYNDGQKYDSHWDWFDHPGHRAKDNPENRIATVLLYLSEVEEGGETTLPIAEAIDPARQAIPHASPCATEGTLAVPPRKGDALLFWDIQPDGISVDRAALHASCPTLKGTKYTATKWIHNQPIGGSFDPLRLAAVCKDDPVAGCDELVKEGKCDSAPDTMLGLNGKCRRSCEDCVECDPTDVLCLRRNMRSLRSVRQQAAAAGAPTLL